MSDITTLKNAMESYTLAKKIVPSPTGNIRYYDVKGNYTHDEHGAFGASAFVAPETFPVEYLASLPTDPQNNHYYAYGKRLDGTVGYEFATIINDGGQYSTYLRGNYDGSKLVSLIREFNGPNFVTDGSIDYLPYDPEDMKLTGRIYYWSGSLLLNGSAFTDPKRVIGEGDTILVGTG